MFFQKKKQENKSLESMLEDYLTQFSETHKRESSDTRKALADLQNEQMEMQQFLRKRMETLDDFLDELQEEKETKDETKDIQNAAADREKELCQLICIYSEQMHALEESLSDKEGWKEQFSMMRQKRNQFCGLAQIQETGNVGEVFEYHIHDIIETERTDQEKMEGIVSKVYSPGLLYQGKIIKKAQVGVYKK